MEHTYNASFIQFSTNTPDLLVKSLPTVERNVICNQSKSNRRTVKHMFLSTIHVHSTMIGGVCKYL